MLELKPPYGALDIDTPRHNWSAEALSNGSHQVTTNKMGTSVERLCSVREASRAWMASSLLSSAFLAAFLPSSASRKHTSSQEMLFGTSMLCCLAHSVQTKTLPSATGSVWLVILLHSALCRPGLHHPICAGAAIIRHRPWLGQGKLLIPCSNWSLCPVLECLVKIK